MIERLRRTSPFVLLIVAVMVAMWLYVIYLAVVEGRADSPDKIDEPAFVAAAEAECANTLEFVASLPRAATQRDDHVARAATVSRANDAYGSMVTELRTIAVVDPGAAELVEAWLADWDTLLDDRAAYAGRLAVDPDARLTITPGPSGRQISLRIDEFAGTNDMPSCKSPVDA